MLIGCEEKLKYWVYLNENYDQQYLKSVLYTRDLKSQFHSKWLNASSVYLDKSDVEYLRSLNCIESVHPVRLHVGLKKFNNSPSKLSFALEQINAEAFTSRGYNGKGVKIGIIDGGFLNANEKEVLEHFFRKNKVKAYKDYVTPGMIDYGGSAKLDDGHGVDVWTNIGGFHPERGIQYGLATEAEFYLARTDHGKAETKSEEEFLIQALEWLDSMEVKLVNISLGYTDEFDDPQYNHLPEHIDGQYTAITRACQYAAEKRGMLLVISAGNDGAKPWNVLSAPADAPGVMTVGATSYKYWDKTSYSSISPEKLSFLKPNVSCFASNGTSFSTPVVTGIAACIMQYDPVLTNSEIITIIEYSSHLYPFGNNFLGYGVPSCEIIIDLLDNKRVRKKIPIEAKSKRVHLSLKSEEGTAIVFHKYDKINVLEQQRQPFSNGSIQISKLKGSAYTTVAIKREVTEIEWIE